MDAAFEFIKSEKGIDTEESYPYKEAYTLPLYISFLQGSCTFKSSSVGATCTGHVDIPSGDEEALKQAVASVGPVSVAIDAHHESFHDYKPDHRDEKLQAGLRRVAGQVDRSEFAVRNCWEQWTREGTHARKTGSGATRKTTRREDRRIVRQALVDPTVTRSTIRADVGVAIVPQTNSRHLAEANL
ncbi:cathepsin L [Trichonephila clavipes]|nr:cathepsin L [Trichonephila clavipes]